MIKSTGFLIALMLSATAFFAHAAESTALPDSPQAWQAATRGDINAAYQQLLDNHPGVFDASNPGFKAQLDSARAAGLDLADKVSDAAGYIAATSVFSTALHDGHAGLVDKIGDEYLRPVRWPGFITVWRGDSLFVHSSDIKDIPRGAKVIACDGLPIRAVILNNVFAYGGRSDEPGHWWARANRVFLDRFGNPFVKLPQQCEFDDAGRRFTQPIDWKPADKNINAQLRAAILGDKLAVGMTEPRPNLFWVAMPTFSPDQADRDTYFELNKKIVAQRSRFLHADAVVIDLRYNQGGSSLWSANFAKALWGASPVERALAAYSAHEETWWRASPGNTDFILSLVAKYREQKLQDVLEWAVKNGSGMLAALQRGDNYYVERDESTRQTGPESKDKYGPAVAAFTRPVYVVVPGDCASACLDALDVFTRFANTKLIGAPSASDSTYMDVRTESLPSGLGMLVIPNKMYVNRPRAAGQGYLPAITVTDLDWSTAGLLQVVERDLADARHGKAR